MKNTITKKEKAIEIMKKMDIYKPYIKGFEERDQVCFFEQFGGFWIDQEPEIYNKMKELEKSITAKFMPLHTNTRNSESFTTFLSLPTIPKNGIRSCTVRVTIIRHLLTFGTKTMTGVRNSVALPYRASAVALKELREVNYESIRSDFRLVYKRRQSRRH